MTAVKPIPTDRFDAARLAARVDKSSGCRFQLVQTRRPACCSVAHSSPALIAASWIRVAAKAATMALLTAASWAAVSRSVLVAR
jgi:hypothetical protein